MERQRKQQLLEQGIYGAIWVVIFLLPLIGGYFAMSGGLEREEIRMIIRDSWLGILPFFMLFLLNNYGLVPYLLFKKKYGQYFVSLFLLIIAVCWFVPSPYMERFRKDFRHDGLHRDVKESPRDQIIKMREKSREKGEAYWNEPEREKPLWKWEILKVVLKLFPNGGLFLIPPLGSVTSFILPLLF